MTPFTAIAIKPKSPTALTKRAALTGDVGGSEEFMLELI
jgi:hypothetical protein